MIEFLLHLALAFEQLVHVVIGHFLGELGVDLFEFFEQIDGLLHCFFDHLAHRARVVYQRLLLQEADGIARRQHGFAVKLPVHARHDAQQRRLARAVETDDADLGAIEVGKINVLQHGALVVILADADHRVDNFVGFSSHGLKRLPRV